MVTQNWQVEILFSKSYSHSFLSTLMFRMVFERNKKPITAPAQGSALHAQNIQTQSFQMISAQFLHSILGSPSPPSPLHPKHQTDRSLQNILAVQSQQALHVIFAVHQHLVMSEKQMFPCFPSDKCVQCAANLHLPSLAPLWLSVTSTKYLITSKQTSQTRASLRNNESASKGGRASFQNNHLSSRPFSIA